MSGVDCAHAHAGDRRAARDSGARSPSVSKKSSWRCSASRPTSCRSSARSAVICCRCVARCFVRRSRCSRAPSLGRSEHARDHARRRRRADASRDARPRRLRRSLRAASRAADGELAVQPPGVRDHGRLSVHARAHGARAAGRPRHHEDRGRRRERADDRRDAAAWRGGCARRSPRRITTISFAPRPRRSCPARARAARCAARRSSASRLRTSATGSAWRFRSPTTSSTTPRTSP